MKLQHLVLGLFLTLASGMMAQDWSTDVYKMGEQYPGYVITEDGKKIEGFIKYQNRYTMQNEVLFFAEKGNRKSKTKYATKDLKEYKVADKLYHCINYSGGLLKKPIRANLVVQEGCITQYVWYNRADNYAVMQKSSSETDEEFMNRLYPSTTILMKQGTKEPKDIGKFLRFAEKMSEFLSDNQEIAAKVRNKEKGYGLLRMFEIIEEYNANCN